MKVKLLVNLKVARGTVISAGTIYSDVDGALPDYITDSLNDSKIIEVLPEPVQLSVPEPTEPEPTEPEPVREVVEQAAPEPEVPQAAPQSEKALKKVVRRG